MVSPVTTEVERRRGTEAAAAVALTAAQRRKFAPYTDEQLRKIAKQLGDIYANAERLILKEMAEGNLTSWGKAFRTQQLAQIRAILSQLDTEVVKWIEFHMPTLYKRGMWVADGYLQPGGLSHVANPGVWQPMDLGMTRLHREAVEILAENMVLRLGEANHFVGQRLDDMVGRARRIADMHDSPLGMEMTKQLVIRDASLGVLGDAFARGFTQEQAKKSFLDDLRERGITGFVDKSGRVWSLDSYAEMVTRTASQEAQRHGTQNRLREAGHDLVQVSSHGGACDVCVPWEDQVLSISGNSSEFPSVDDAYGSGLFHPNCLHALLPFIRRAA